ncbi:hypothetical protein H6F89_15140 [Cyanobacteria bacterium FACHB-63]|nr:hypothetical protein [Cyanobacteria bacterium FACHB-63]
MESGRGQITKPETLLKILNLLSYVFPRRRKTHDYTCYEMGIDYFFESISYGSKGYMTGQGKGIRKEDFLLLRFEGVSVVYQVEDINYYSNPSDMWTASLMKVQSAS